ncbi:MAG: MBL fold metallo-hydrolase, partial [archaeon]|nr:MBL fold metallo-hydrolase [archaeon]
KDNALFPEIVIIYDNNPGKTGLKSSWGFSCLVKTEGKQFLFDTGGDSSILLDNMKNMNIDPTKMNSIILSHTHGDHTGGLFGLLKINYEINVYLSHSSLNGFKEKVKSFGTKIVEVKDFKEFSQGIFIVEEKYGEHQLLQSKKTRQNSFPVLTSKKSK